MPKSTTKIVKDDYNISGMEVWSMWKQYRTFRRLPLVAIAEGPTYKYLIELAKLHYLGRLDVVCQLKYPKLYKVFMRVKNSLVFRFNHYRKVIKRKLAK